MNDGTKQNLKFAAMALALMIVAFIGLPAFFRVAAFIDDSLAHKLHQHEMFEEPFSDLKAKP